MGASDFDLLQRYWDEEPWGAYRDNVHAAIIAREVRAGTVKGVHAIKDFLLQTAARKAQQERGGFFGAFRAMVKRKRND